MRQLESGETADPGGPDEGPDRLRIDRLEVGCGQIGEAADDGGDDFDL